MPWHDIHIGKLFVAVTPSTGHQTRGMWVLSKYVNCPVRARETLYPSQRFTLKNETNFINVHLLTSKIHNKGEKLIEMAPERRQIDNSHGSGLSDIFVARWKFWSISRIPSPERPAWLRHCQPFVGWWRLSFFSRSFSDAWYCHLGMGVTVILLMLSLFYLVFISFVLFYISCKPPLRRPKWLQEGRVEM